jgi:hypothetical protein
MPIFDPFFLLCPNLDLHTTLPFNYPIELVALLT